MTNDEILQKIIDKAEINGWDGEDLKDQLNYGFSGYNDYWIYFYIFSHEFAKAFWGEKKKCKCSGFCIQYQGCSCEANISGWQYHLQQMILCEEPLKYLEKFL